MDDDWQADLERWLAPYLEGLGNKTRRRMCPAYIASLIGPGDRKSIQPVAARAEAIAYDRLHHFIGGRSVGQLAAGSDLVEPGDRNGRR